MKSNIPQYLLVLFGVATFAGYLWGLCYMVQSFETFAFSILLGYLTGFVASLYFTKKNRFIYPFTAFIATLWGFIVAKHLIFTYLSVYIADIETNKMWLGLKILFSFQNFGEFWSKLGSEITTFDQVWLLLAIIFSIIYGSKVRHHKRKFYLLKKQVTDFFAKTKEV